ncbi:hypothetical protein Pmani_037642 [Petrolisthes manimaculis]|uniref:Uncharacterized protein n=1 Tax=Petrolisthes manimaculis TaxID=1843537 RepID=A0AAE1NHW1_9EUCA|nr:hypothetical protein Pmani_037642 [Petrolisthes manimaculis]
MKSKALIRYAIAGVRQRDVYYILLARKCLVLYNHITHVKKVTGQQDSRQLHQKRAMTHSVKPNWLTKPY